VFSSSLSTIVHLINKFCSRDKKRQVWLQKRERREFSKKYATQEQAEDDKLILMPHTHTLTLWTTHFLFSHALSHTHSHAVKMFDDNLK